MIRRLRILVVEDSEADFNLHVRNLQKNGMAADLHRVETLDGLDAAIQRQYWDAVLSDYSLPGLDFRTVLGRLKEKLPGIPIILVSGSVGEEAAVALLKEGVWDFVWKDRPGRLAQALTHCLEEAKAQNTRRRTEAALRQSEGRYRSLFEHMLDGYANCRIIEEDGQPVDWTYLDVNPAFERLTGLQDVVGRRVSEVIPGIHATNPELIQVYGRVAATGVPERLVSQVASLGIWFSTSIYSPTPGEFVAVFDNITERKRAEHDLQEAMYRLKMATAAGGFGVWDHDLSTGSLVWDECQYRIYGLDPGPVDVKAWQGLIHPEDRGSVLEAVQKTYRSSNELAIAFRIIRPDGAVRHIHSLGLLVRDPEGNVVRVLGLAQDITERIESEQARRESDEMFLSLAEGVSDAFYVHDFEGRILAVNQHACDSLGYSREELLAMKVPDLAEAFDLPATQAVWASLRPRHGQTLVDRHRRKDGTTFPVEVLVNCMDLKGRRVYLGMVRDISERVAAEAERHELEGRIRHAEKLDSLGSLASGLAHDMNNVLAAVLAVAQVLRLKLEEDPSFTSALDTIIKAANRGRDLVRGLTNFARKDLRAAEPLDLNAIVKDEAALLERTLRQKVRLEVDLEASLPRFQGEPGNFGSALMNLCVNAVDAMPGGGVLTLRTRNLGNGWLELRVEDTGTGMSPEVIRRATEPFFTTKEVGKGTGLGLAMVHGMVKAHGGDLDIQSRPGEGTRIRIRLPALAEGILEQASIGGPGARKTRSLKVLLVDDDELIQATVPLLLQHLGHQPISATSGEEGLALLADGSVRPDVVILDLNMPGLGGEATYLRLRQGHPHLPILIATGFMDPSTSRLIQGDPDAGCITKPFSIDELSRKLEALPVTVP